MKHYNKFCDLITDYLDYLDISQANFADRIEVEEKTIGRWKLDKSLPSDENIYDLSEISGIPFEVIFRLVHSYPTFFDLKTKRYATCPFNKDFVNKKIIQQELFNTNETGNVIYLSKHPNLSSLLEFNNLYYPYKKNIDKSVILHSYKALKDLNLFVREWMNFECGHLICIPITWQCYIKLSTGEMKEYEITTKDIASISSENKIAIHIYSFFSTHSTFIYYLMKCFVNFMLLNYPANLHHDSVISRYVVTDHGIELSKKMGLKMINSFFEDKKQFQTEVCPQFFSSPIHDLKWIMNYKEKIHGI